MDLGNNCNNKTNRSIEYISVSTMTVDHNDKNPRRAPSARQRGHQPRRPRVRAQSSLEGMLPSTPASSSASSPSIMTDTSSHMMLRGEDASSGSSSSTSSTVTNANSSNMMLRGEDASSRSSPSTSSTVTNANSKEEIAATTVVSSQCHYPSSSSFSIPEASSVKQVGLNPSDEELWQLRRFLRLTKRRLLLSAVQQHQKEQQKKQGPTDPQEYQQRRDHPLLPQPVTTNATSVDQLRAILMQASSLTSSA